jgi:hypothetical protein
MTNHRRQLKTSIRSVLSQCALFNYPLANGCQYIPISSFAFAASASTNRHQRCAVGYHYGCSVEHNQMPALELA